MIPVEDHKEVDIHFEIAWREYRNQAGV